MFSKRSRATYEADLAAQPSPYVFFGTPLPPADPDVRDDGSYVPLWKQEVRDERGRKRLHGAFTGGWSAGYFNTVGSKEGWTPSTFVSSRTNRRKDAPDAQPQRPEDFMDEEDLRDAEEAKKIQTNAGFGALGAAQHDDDDAGFGGLTGLFRVRGETMGAKLLRRMGWKEGQGIGPKVRRRARLDASGAAGGGRDGEDGGETFLFAPEDVPPLPFVRKTDRKGLGYAGAPSLTSLRGASRGASRAPSDEEPDGGGDDRFGSLGRPRFAARKKPADRPRGGIGIGVLNDTGSDDEEDPYEVGPRISYHRVVGGDKKDARKKKTGGATPVNPAVRAKPAFVPKSLALGRVGLGARRCHDGRLPLDGFVFGRAPDPLLSEINAPGKYPPPQIPPGWQPSRQPERSREAAGGADPGAHASLADVAKAAPLDPRARAALLGETPLPGKSVFDFLSASARERLAAATGKTDLPPAKGEIPQGYARTEAERLRELLGQVPRLDPETAAAALARGAGASAPYGDDEAKRARYRAYLEGQAGGRPSLPPKPPGMSHDDWLREFHEFYRCARIFKPMTGLMASRFAPSSAALPPPPTDTPGRPGSEPPGPKRAPAPKDPAEEAAQLGMYGSLTRTVTAFYPTRLLCKRFHVRPPPHVRGDHDQDARQGPSAQFDIYGDLSSSVAQQQQPQQPQQPSFSTQLGGPPAGSAAPSGPATPHVSGDTAGKGQAADHPAIDPSRNEALEGKRAGEEVFKAIFGDDSDEE